jgi:hypothetical protein
MFDWLKSWRESRELKKLVRQRGTLLKQRYGFQEFYSPEQVSRTAAAAGLDQQGEAYAIAMYVQPTDAIRILTIMRDAKWANEIRKIMIGPCFGFSGGNDGSSDYNVFAHHSTGHHGAFDGSHGSYDGGHSHGGDSGGHSGGDGGGGH